MSFIINMRIKFNKLFICKYLNTLSLDVFKIFELEKLLLAISVCVVNFENSWYFY